MKNLFLIFLLGLPWITLAQEKATALNLDNKTDFSEFDVFADSLDKYQVYFTGENHSFLTFDSKLEYKMLTYLHNTQGVEHFIFEQSPAVGYLVETVIIDNNTENRKYLKDMFFAQFYQMFKNIEKFNDTLALENKIHLHGIDIERFPYFSIKALNLIADTLDTSVPGGEVFEQIKALGTSEYEYGTAADYYADGTTGGFGFGQVSAWESLSSIIKISLKYEESLKKELGKDSTIYFSIIESLEVGHEWYVTELKGDVRSPIIRERFMQDEFERVYNSDPTSKFYGQFGRCHLHKNQRMSSCYDYYMNSIANRIGEINDSLKNKVLVIPVFYSTGILKFDKDVIKDLDLEEKYLEEGTAYIIDLAYKNGDHNISGFYNQLPFVIISNVKEEPFEEFNFAWNEKITEIHFGASYGYHYFTGIRSLNSALVDFGATTFTDKMVGYNFAVDFLEVGSWGNRAYFNYFPEISNNDRFYLKGWRFGMGQYYTFGNKWVLAALGLDYAYGQTSLTEEMDNTVPNLIQSDGQNIIIYKNDVFTFDPNLELRLTLPIISLNFKTGYSLDVSGKRWRLDGKMKDFTKTSFSAPYIQAGVSINFKSTQ
ncbi:MAG: hypothetical protein ABJG68_13340 [Crocinitomicaceae bacterium]